MKHLLYLIIIFVLVCMFGCSDRRATSVLNHADSLLSTHPDTVLVMLDSLRAERSSDMSRRQKMRLELLRADAQNKAFVNFTTDSVMREVTAYYDAHGTAQERMRAHYLLGCTYRDMGDAPRALECYHDAIDMADTTSADCDYKLLSRVYGQMAVLFQDAYLPYNQIEQLKNSYHYALKAKDTLGAICSYDYMGSAYYLLDNYDSCIIINEKSSYLFAKHGYKIQSARSLGLLSSVYVDKNDLNNAKRCIETYEREGGVFDQYGNIEKGREIFYYNKGMYLLSCNKLDSAEYYFRKTLSSGVDKNNRVAGCNGLIELYRKLGNNDSIAKYSNMCQSLYASINKDIMSQTLPKMQSMYDYNRFKQSAEKKRREAERYRNMIIIGGILSLAIISAIIYVVIRNKRRAQDEFTALNTRYFDTLTKYNQSVKDLSMLQNDTDKYRNQKEKETEALRQTLAAYTKEDAEQAKWDAEQYMLHCDIVNELHCLADRGMPASVSNWSALTGLTSQHLVKFHQHLSAPQYALSEREIIVCILIKLKFMPSEMAILFDCSKQIITNIRTSINHKLFNQEGTKTLDYNLKSL